MANIGYIQVNRYCNNACHFCSNPSNGNNITYEKGIELIDDFISKGYSGVIFTGGEPTLSPNLYKWIAYTKQKGIGNRMISNGMMCSDPKFIQKLADNGLELIHFSVFSCYNKVHDFLTDTPGSWDKLMKSITNALNSGIKVHINTVINHYNEGHLDKTVKFLTNHFPPISHFIWNNLDPLMMRKTKTAISTLPDFENKLDKLHIAMKYLVDTGRTFRVECIPLCYLEGYEWSSTESRKIVKNEERIVHFLDDRGSVRQHGNLWANHKKTECKNCDLSAICAGVPLGGDKEVYNYMKVYPKSLSSGEKKEIIKKFGDKFN